MNSIDEIVRMSTNIKNAFLKVKYNINDEDNIHLEFTKNWNSTFVTLHILSYINNMKYIANDIYNFFRKILNITEKDDTFWLLIDNNEETLKILSEYSTMSQEELLLYFKLGGL